MKTPIKLNKIPIASLINVLQHLYEEGADYIDLQGEHTPGDANDVIKVTVRPEYYVLCLQEIFVQNLTNTVYGKSSNKRNVEYKDLSELVEDDERLEFLQG